eukprot:365684-Chlamydomonas_euryale.AAC.9
MPVVQWRKSEACQLPAMHAYAHAACNGRGGDNLATTLPHTCAKQRRAYVVSLACGPFSRCTPAWGSFHVVGSCTARTMLPGVVTMSRQGDPFTFHRPARPASSTGPQASAACEANTPR